MPPETDGPEIDPEGLIEDLASTGGLHSLLADSDVKSALLQELRDLSVPAPGLVYRLLCFATGRCENFLGGAIASRMSAMIEKTPALAAVFQRIANLKHGEKSADTLKAKLLDAIKDGKPFDAADIAADEATSLELVIALHSANGLQTVADKQDELAIELLSGFRKDIEDLFQDLVEPNLRWPDVASDPDDQSAFNRLKYTAGIDRFVGREEEIDLLHRFSGDPSFAGEKFHFRWMLMTGEGGSGKTRLAFSFTREHLDVGIWVSGKLDVDSLAAFTLVDKWRPRQPTFIVIDYAQTVPEQANRLLRAMSANAKFYEFPVRLLLLERRSDPSWTDKMLPNDSNQQMITDHCFGGKGIDGIDLRPLMRGEIMTLVKGRFERQGKPAPPDDELFNNVVRVDPRSIQVEHQGQSLDIPVPRPLFAVAVADALIAANVTEEDAPIVLTQEGVLSEIIKRDRLTRWTLAVPDQPTLRRYERALALATLVQGLDLSILSDQERHFGEKAAKWLPTGGPDLDMNILEVFGVTGTQLTSLEPDILGEFFVLELLTHSDVPADVKSALLNGCMRLNHPAPSVFLLRVRNDFPNRFEELLSPNDVRECKDLAALRVFSALSVDYVNICANQNDLSAATQLLDAISDANGSFKDREIALGEVRAAVNVTSDAGSAQDWPRVEAMLARLDRARAAYPDDREIALEEAKAAVNVTHDAGSAQDRARVEAMLARLDKVRAACPDDQEIALAEAKAAVNVTHHAGSAQDWPRVEAMLARLDGVRAAYPDDREIALEEAKAAVNVTHDAGSAQDWPLVEAMLARLDGVRAACPDDREIALREARAAVNVTNDAGSAQDWPRVEAMLARLDGVRSAFPDDREIALLEVQAAVNVTNNAGSAQDWPRVEAMLARVEVLAEKFGVDFVVVQQDDRQITLGTIIEAIKEQLEHKPPDQD